MMKKKENKHKGQEHYEQLRNYQLATISKLKNKHSFEYMQILPHLTRYIFEECSGYIVGSGTMFGTHVPIHCDVRGDFISVAILVVPLFAADP